MRGIDLVVCLAVALAGCVRGSVEPGDRQLLLAVNALEEYGIKLPRDISVYETYSREKWFDGTMILEYEFDASSNAALPYLYSLAEIHPTKLDACVSHESGKLGTSIAGVELTIRNDLFQYGDRSDFGLLVDDDEAYGNYFSMCRGRTSFSVLLSGVYFEDGKMWGDLVAPALEALESRRIN